MSIDLLRSDDDASSVGVRCVLSNESREYDMPSGGLLQESSTGVTSVRFASYLFDMTTMPAVTTRKQNGRPIMLTKARFFHSSKITMESTAERQASALE